MPTTPDYAVCGIDCAACRHRAAQGCPGCRAVSGKPFWGDCDLYGCAASKARAHCGQCESFPCGMLNEWAAQENPERVDNLRGLGREVS